MLVLESLCYVVARGAGEAAKSGSFRSTYTFSSRASTQYAKSSTSREKTIVDLGWDKHCVATVELESPGVGEEGAVARRGGYEGDGLAIRNDSISTVNEDEVEADLWGSEEADSRVWAWGQLGFAARVFFTPCANGTGCGFQMEFAVPVPLKKP